MLSAFPQDLFIYFLGQLNRCALQQTVPEGKTVFEPTEAKLQG